MGAVRQADNKLTVRLNAGSPPEIILWMISRGALGERTFFMRSKKRSESSFPSGSNKKEPYFTAQLKSDRSDKFCRLFCLSDFSSTAFFSDCKFFYHFYHQRFLYAVSRHLFCHEKYLCIITISGILSLSPFVQKEQNLLS
jgi:hypothetical protein